MLNFLHTFHPQPILVSFGGLTVHWYGMIMLFGIILGLWLVLRLAPQFGIKKDDIWDLSFWLVLGAIIGARIYEIFLFFDYYSMHPGEMLKVWQGGLAIHGAWLGGLLVVMFFARRRSLSLLRLLDLLSFGLILGQVIGRWGNYFNQELFGQPTGQPWGIPIDLPRRPAGFKQFEYFHPTFLYESLLNLVVGGFLLIVKKLRQRDGVIFFTYLIGYSVIRFSLEYIRLDDTPAALGLRWPQILSVLTVLVSLVAILFISFRSKPSAT